jgi:hypothetical protein
LRLLIDEMYPAAIAEQLRRRGHDASTVTERAELSDRTRPFALRRELQDAGRRARVTEL